MRAYLRRRTHMTALVVALSLVVAGCTEADPTTTSAAPTTTAAAACDMDNLPLVTPGTLTVATGEVVFPPWMGVGDDNFDVPESKTGYEGALVYAIAAELGIPDENVVFVRTGFDEAIAPGPKDWDFNIQQYTITAQRDEVVDFSDPYYTADQALVTDADSEFANARTLADLADAVLGAAIGTTSLDFIEDVIRPNTEPSVYDETVDVNAAINAGQIDGVVVDLPTAYFMTAVQLDNGVIVGQFVDEPAEPNSFGMLFAEGNELVACVNEAIATLAGNGTLQALEEEWLNQGGDLPLIGS